jgi:hypothetical protein
MENKQNSSISWLSDEYNKLFISYQKSEISTSKFILLTYRLEEVAQKIHKGEIKLAWNHGFDWGQMEQSLAEQVQPSTLIDSEHYYNETYGTTSGKSL